MKYWASLFALVVVGCSSVTEKTVRVDFARVYPECKLITVDNISQESFWSRYRLTYECPGKTLQLTDTWEYLEGGSWYLKTRSVAIGTEDERVVEYLENGQIRSETDMNDGKPHGKYSLRDEGGSLLQTGYYAFGQKDSVWVRYRGDGTAKERATYKQGGLNGPLVAWHEDGKMSYRGIYAGDRLDSVWTWYPGGKPKRSGVYDGAYTLVETLWNVDGSVRSVKQGEF